MGLSMRDLTGATVNTGFTASASFHLKQNTSASIARCRYDDPIHVALILSDTTLVLLWFCDGVELWLALYIHIIPTRLCTLNTITGISIERISW